MLKVTGQAIFSKINAKTLEHPGPCSVLGAGHYPRTGIRGGGSRYATVTHNHWGPLLLSKVFCVCFGFALLRFVIGFKN